MQEAQQGGSRLRIVGDALEERIKKNGNQEGDVKITDGLWKCYRFCVATTDDAKHMDTGETLQMCCMFSAAAQEAPWQGPAS